MPKPIHRLAQALMRCYPFPRGQGRLIDRTPLCGLRFAERGLSVRCCDGFTMKVEPNDHIGRHLYLTGQFDRTIVEVLLSFCRGGERILDIGANIGYVSCALLHLVPNCRVVAVEPAPSTYELLAQNIASVGRGRGKAINAAVSDLEGSGLMRVSRANSGANSLASNSFHETTAGSVVPVALITGARLWELSDLDQVDLIKIDVEGHENTVFSTLGPLLSEQPVRAVVFEHGGNLGDPSAPIRRLLDDLGYQIHGLRKSLMRWSLTPLEQMVEAGRCAHDYVAVPAPKLRQSRPVDSTVANGRAGY